MIKSGCVVYDTQNDSQEVYARNDEDVLNLIVSVSLSDCICRSDDQGEKEDDGREGEEGGVEELEQCPLHR